MPTQPPPRRDCFFILTLQWQDDHGPNIRSRTGLAEDCRDATDQEIFEKIFADAIARCGAPEQNTAILYYHLADNDRAGDR